MIEATGGNAKASALAGVGTRAMTLAVYVWCGLCAALAGVIAAADILGADANNAGLWLELDAILAVVIGGTSLFGGRFSLVLAVLGALIIQAMNTGILLSGYPPEFNLVVKAVVVLVVKLAVSVASGNAKSPNPPEPPVALELDAPSPGGGEMAASDAPPAPCN